MARNLDAEFSIVVCCKLPFLDDPESGFGALAEDGGIYLMLSVSFLMQEQGVQEIINEQKNEISCRIEILRMGQPLPEIGRRQLFLLTMI